MERSKAPQEPRWKKWGEIRFYRKKSHSNICMQNSASMMLFSLLKRRRAWHTESVRARTLYFLAATNGNFIHSDLAPNGILLMGKLFSCCSPSLSHPRLSVSTAEQELNSVSLLKAHRLQHVWGLAFSPGEILPWNNSHTKSWCREVWWGGMGSGHRVCF
jgi:hypothetical protein